ncbi:GNAT family N-acetyltransferase [Myxococcus stipitatus]|uniref:GNAT family N-acetyltransferase n=1 Tax=Myxococcus stipitatus TaxID=83455 RepID=UPI0030D35CFB
MHSATQAEIDESHAQFRGAWRRMALGSRAGEVVERPEVYLAACNVAWDMMNGAFLRAPVESEQGLAAAAASAARYFSMGKHPWSFIVSEDWLAPQVRAQAASILAWYKLKPLTSVTGMVCEKLAAPTRPPSPLEVRPVVNAWGRQAVADINALSYDMPKELGREAMDVESFFGTEARGFVACQGDAAASSSVVLRVDDIAYIALVATRPEHRRIGAAEAAMRRALHEARDAWGIERSVLHATEAGFPLYLRLGYRPVTRFLIYSAPAPGMS